MNARSSAPRVSPKNGSIAKQLLPPLPDKDITPAWGAFMATLVQIATEVDEARAAETARVLWAEHRRFNLWRKVPDGLIAALAELRARGVPVAVVSNSEGQLQTLFDNLGIGDAFDLVIDSHLVGVEKPDPRIFAPVLARFGVAAADALHLGDTFATDVVGARAAGLRVALIDPFAHYDGQYPDVARVDGVAAACRSIVARLRRNCGRRQIDRAASNVETAKAPRGRVSNNSCRLVPATRPIGSCKRAQAGDRAAFDDLVRRYRARIYALTLHLTGSRSEADDITQDVFTRAYQQLHTFAGRSEFFTWLYRIAVNRALNARRDTARRRTSGLDDPRVQAAVAVDAYGDPRRAAELRQTYARLVDALDRLSPTLRSTVVLVALQGLSHDEAAAVLGCPSGTVAWRIHEARNQLRASLEGVVDDVGDEAAELRRMTLRARLS